MYPRNLTTRHKDEDELDGGAEKNLFKLEEISFTTFILKETDNRKTRQDGMRPLKFMWPNKISLINILRVIYHSQTRIFIWTNHYREHRVIKSITRKSKSPGWIIIHPPKAQDDSGYENDMGRVVK